MEKPAKLGKKYLDTQEKYMREVLGLSEEDIASAKKAYYEELKKEKSE